MGATARPSVALCEPHIGGKAWRYVKECLDSGWVSSASGFVGRFEDEFARRLGAGCAVATASGTSAVHVALMCAGVRPDDEVLVSDLSFIAPANAVRYIGAQPVFVDARRDTWQFDPALLAEFLAHGCERRGEGLHNKASDRRIAALLIVHVLGHAAEVAGLLQIAGEYGLPVIEDAAESLGATYDGRHLGTFGRLGCFSFNGNKLMTTGGGGMIVTNDDALAAHARYVTTQAKDDGDEGVHGAVGYNYRMTGLQAALGCAQLEDLDKLLAAKRRIAQHYADAVAALPGIVAMPEAAHIDGSFWLYTVRVDLGLAGVDADGLMRALREAGIATRRYWQPMHLSPAHVGAQCLGGAVSASLHQELLSLPSSCGLDAATQDRVIAALARALNS